MAIPSDKLISMVGKSGAKALADAGYSVLSEPERLGWHGLLEKYEFIVSAMDLMARKPLREDPGTDAQELRGLVEESLKMIGVIKGATPFDNLRLQLSREENWRDQAMKILLSILESRSVDSGQDSAIRSLLCRNPSG